MPRGQKPRRQSDGIVRKQASRMRLLQAPDENHGKPSRGPAAKHAPRQRIRRHAERRIFAKQRCQFIYVIPVESIYIAIKKLCLHLGHRRVFTDIPISQCRSRSLQCTVHRSNREVKTLGGFRCRPTKNFDEK